MNFLFASYLCVMYYRRKVILALLQNFGGSLEKTQLQELLLLFTQKQENPDYYFVPYQYGCYSFQAVADISTMQKYGQVKEKDSRIEKADTSDYINLLHEKDQIALTELHRQHAHRSDKDLARYTYTHYPYFATHNEMAGNYPEARKLKKAAGHSSSKTILYTIGYEGISLEQYLNKLIENDIKLLIDVRNTPMSRKFGFTKSQLQRACATVETEYLHLPEVGIIPEQRQQLVTAADYDKMFARYRKNTLPHTIATQEKILGLLKEKKRIALTCYEADADRCHRKHLADAILQLPGWHYKLIHL